MLKIVGRQRVLAVLWLMVGACLAGCVSRDYDSIKRVNGRVEEPDHKFRTPAGFKPIAGNSYPIPVAHGQPHMINSDRNGRNNRLPARTADDKYISILPPGANI